MPRLTRVAVTRLLDRFDHEIVFPSDDPFVIIYGPNGVGKTKLLELIAAVSNGELEATVSMPFESATFTYSDGALLELSRQTVSGPDEEGFVDEWDPTVVATLHAQDTKTVWAIEPNRLVFAASAMRRWERDLPVSRVSAHEWHDYETGEILSSLGVAERYGEQTGSRYVQSRPEEATVVLEFLSGSPAHMVETQRLVVGRRITSKKRAAGGRPAPSTVEQYAADLSGRIREALAENSTVSQRLDRSFPKRLLTQGEPSDELTDEALRARYAAQSEIRDQLANISVSDAAEAIELPERDLEPWERGMLNTYMNDADVKLATFEVLLNKLNLFTKIVNSRFLFKNLTVNRETGFQFHTPEGIPLAPAELSSGEQHELVLNYDLLFNVAPGSLVLIDEPEISLHVAWQQAFLGDIGEISTLVDARFIIATHSPQVIHNWRSRAHSLYEVD